MPDNGFGAPDGFAGRVALVTGGSGGIGAGVARRLAGLGAHVVVADVDAAAGEAVAAEVGGAFVRCDVREPADNEAAVALAVDRFGGLDVVHLNAGVSSGCGIGADFDLELYRRAMGINLDGVVFGVQAALPALRARGGGAIVATASLAGLAAMPMDPVYGANKAAVVGLVRALGPALAAEGITVNALCPSFAQTAIIDGFEHVLRAGNVPILSVDEVVDTFLAAVASEGTGEAWYVVPGRVSEPFRFRNVPGPRTPDGERAAARGAEQQVDGSLGGVTRMIALGIDIGGTGIKGAPVDTATGRLTAERFRVQTPHPATPEAVTAVVKQVVEHFGWSGPVGVTFPGVVVNGTVRTAANVDHRWLDTDVAAMLCAALGHPVRVLNDADAAGLAEERFGAAAGLGGVVLLLTLGTGIGAALLVDGRLVPNTELGHVEVRGKEAERRASELVRERKDLSWEKWADRVSEVLRTLEALLWPDLFVIGGGVSAEAEKFIPLLQCRTRVVPATLANAAGIVGAALWAAAPALPATPVGAAGAGA